MPPKKDSSKKSTPRKKAPLNKAVTANTYGFVKTYNDNELNSITVFYAEDARELFGNIESFVSDSRFHGTPLSLHDGYEFTPESAEDYDRVWCYICEDAEDMMRQLQKCGIPKESLVNGLDNCKYGQEAISSFFDSLNENFVEMITAQKEAKLMAAAQAADDYGAKGYEDSSDDWSDSAEEYDDEEFDASEEYSDEETDGEEAKQLSPSQIQSLLMNRFDALKKQVKKDMPSTATEEAIAQQAFCLLKEEYPAYLEDVEFGE